jgi:hypothetical protein
MFTETAMPAKISRTRSGVFFVIKQSPMEFASPQYVSPQQFGPGITTWHEDVPEEQLDTVQVPVQVSLLPQFLSFAPFSVPQPSAMASWARGTRQKARAKTAKTVVLFTRSLLLRKGKPRLSLLSYLSSGIFIFSE